MCVPEPGKVLLLDSKLVLQKVFQLAPLGPFHHHLGFQRLHLIGEFFHVIIYHLNNGLVYCVEQSFPPILPAWCWVWRTFGVLLMGAVPRLMAKSPC